MIENNEIHNEEQKKILIDEEELRKRNERIKRFGIVEPIRPTEKQILKSRTNHRDRRHKSKLDYKSQSDEEKEIEPIKPIKEKEDFRLNIDENSEFSKKRLVLFGVNLMSTGDVEDYFDSRNFKVKKMFWLNDFTCVVEFDSEEVAIQAFAEFCAFQINKETSDLENFNWKKSLPFVIDEEKVLELEMRMSEVNDINKKSSREDSTFYKFYNRRRKNIDHRYSRRPRERSRDRERERSRDRERERSRDREKERSRDRERSRE